MLIIGVDTASEFPADCVHWYLTKSLSYGFDSLCCPHWCPWDKLPRSKSPSKGEGLIEPKAISMGSASATPTQEVRKFCEKFREKVFQPVLCFSKRALTIALGSDAGFVQSALPGWVKPKTSIPDGDRQAWLRQPLLFISSNIPIG